MSYIKKDIQSDTLDILKWLNCNFKIEPQPDELALAYFLENDDIYLWMKDTFTVKIHILDVINISFKKVQYIDRFKKILYTFNICIDTKICNKAFQYNNVVILEWLFNEYKMISTEF
jgi:hypothetical protein